MEQSLFAIDAVVEGSGGALSWVEYLNELLAKLEVQPVYGRCTRLHESADYQKAIKWAYLSDKISWDEQNSEAQEVRQSPRKVFWRLTSPQKPLLSCRVTLSTKYY